MASVFGKMTDEELTGSPTGRRAQDTGDGRQRADEASPDSHAGGHVWLGVTAATWSTVFPSSPFPLFFVRFSKCSYAVTFHICYRETPSTKDFSTPAERAVCCTDPHTLSESLSVPCSHLSWGLRGGRGPELWAAVGSTGQAEESDTTQSVRGQSPGGRL